MDSLSSPLISDSIYSYIYSNYTNEGFAYLQSTDKSFLFMEPYFKFWADSSGSYSRSSGSEKNYTDIWQALRDCLELKSQQDDRNAASPCCAGFFAYELCSVIEELRNKNSSLNNLPLYEFYLYKKVIEIEGDKIKYYEFQPPASLEVFWDEKPLTGENGFSPENFLNQNSAPLSEIEDKLAVYSNFTKADYLNSVSEVIDQIQKGNVYQVNLTQQFALPFEGEAFRFFYAYSKLSPAPYGSLFNTAGNYIISASPELFLSYDGSILQTSPIKGTILREKDDSSEISFLKNSPKNLSELTMITDIERNDLSRIALRDTVKVKNHARIQSTGQVHHMVSDITCRIDPQKTLIDIIRAMFPSGSITGAPKIAAMDCIARLERSARGVYTGSIGWLAPNGNFSFNVAIRTAQIFKDKIFYSAGGGVVYDSVPEEEYKETLAKTKGFYLALKSILADNK